MMMIRALFFGVVALFWLLRPVQAQDMVVYGTTGDIRVDGVMDEAVWDQVEPITDFMQYFPYDSSLADAQTEVYVTYDKNFIYVAAKMYNLSSDREYVTPSLRRDFRGRAFDSFSFVIDTFKDKTNAFLFGVNPFGVQREGLIANGGGASGNNTGNQGNNSFSLNWDNKWYSAAQTYGEYWIAEMAIPFKTLRYKNGAESFYVNFYRIDSEEGERSTWAPIPRNLSIINLAFNKEMKWDKPLGSPGTNISLIPYVAFETRKDHEEGTPTENSFTGGGDAKIAVTPALNLDLTINPDFSQVEVDQQVTNLDRFEIFFPERRQFFLENADLFANFGSRGVRPFFSRRIGIALDSASDLNVQNPLYFGARLSGKIDDNWRIGAMTVQAAEDKEIGLPSTNYSVLSVQRKVWTRSNVGMIFVNKQAFQDSIGAEMTISPEKYNRVLGLDFNLATADNKWTGNAYYHHSFDNEKLDSTFAAGANLNFNTYRWEARTRLRSTGANYNPEVGFVRRTDIQQWATTIYYNFYPKKGKIQLHSPGIDWDLVGNQTYGFLDWDVNLLYRIIWRSTASFSMRLRRQYTYLFEPFDPSGTDGIELPADTEYYNNQIIASYNSDQRKKFFYRISTRSGQYFNGTWVRLTGDVTYRFQPLGSFSMTFAYNRIRLPEPYNDADLLLIGPRLDLTFTKNLFWTTFIQYNNQIENFNINSRLQWRYKPVSDLFIVYTDNYLAGVDGRFIDFSLPKVRALVIKLTYWLNL